MKPRATDIGATSLWDAISRKSARPFNFQLFAHHTTELHHQVRDKSWTLSAKCPVQYGLFFNPS